MAKLEAWLGEFGIDESGVKEIQKIVDDPETANKMAENRKIVENELRVKGIPTMLYDGKKHTGLWEQ